MYGLQGLSYEKATFHIIVQGIAEKQFFAE